VQPASIRGHSQSKRRWRANGSQLWGQRSEVTGVTWRLFVVSEIGCLTLSNGQHIDKTTGVCDNGSTLTLSGWVEGRVSKLTTQKTSYYNHRHLGTRWCCLWFRDRDVSVLLTSVSRLGWLSRAPHLGCLGLIELVHKVAHPGHSDSMQTILECINAAGWNSLTIQGIPTINYTACLKKYPRHF